MKKWIENTYVIESLDSEEDNNNDDVGDEEHNDADLEVGNKERVERLKMT